MKHSETDDSKFDSAVNVYTSLCRMIDNKRTHGSIAGIEFTMDELEDLRDEAWRMIEASTVDHILAVHELKKELNLL